jgi:hypothetical protein
MSHNSANHETFPTRWRRRLSRCYKSVLGLPLTLDDISTVRCPKVQGVIFEACRDGGATWSVYRFYGVSYDKKKRLVHETLYVGLSIGEALDTLYHLHPDAIRRPGRGISHPVTVARIVGHVFGSTD